MSTEQPSLIGICNVWIRRVRILGYTATPNKYMPPGTIGDMQVIETSVDGRVINARFYPVESRGFGLVVWPKWEYVVSDLPSIASLENSVTDQALMITELRQRIDRGMEHTRSEAVRAENQSNLLFAQKAELAKSRLRERVAWSTVKALAVAYHAPASERAADAALAALDAQEKLEGAA